MTDFLAQPHHRTLGDYLSTHLRDAAWTEFRAAIAFVKRSGTSRILPDLQGALSRGMSARISVGVDAGGTSREGLEALLSVASATCTTVVVHNASTAPHRTFHPKVYLFCNANRADIVVGSGNLTAGGLYANYEAGLRLELDLTIEPDLSIYLQVRDVLDEWSDVARPTVRNLTPELLALLVQHGLVPRERDAWREDEGDESIQERTTAAAGARALFGTEGAPPPPGNDDVPGITTGSGQRAPIPAVEVSWSKVLPRSDALHPPGQNSNVTGNMRLTKAGHPIDFRTFFRRELFGGAAWRPATDRQGNHVEQADIAFEVTVAGTQLGPVTLTVDYGAHREEGQNNHTTVLYWSKSAVAAALHATDLTGHLLTIERWTDGTFTLVIT